MGCSCVGVEDFLFNPSDEPRRLVVYLHNKFRHKHKAQFLQLSYELCQLARIKILQLIKNEIDIDKKEEEDNKDFKIIDITNYLKDDNTGYEQDFIDYEKYYYERDSNIHYEKDDFDNEIGENLYISTEDRKNNDNIINACKIWYNEKNKYNFDLNKYQKGTGHFTQMVWKETQKIGFSYCKLKNGKSIFLVLYYPIGNEIFKFKKNVEKNQNNN